MDILSEQPVAEEYHICGIKRKVCYNNDALSFLQPCRFSRQDIPQKEKREGTRRPFLSKMSGGKVMGTTGKMAKKLTRMLLTVMMMLVLVPVLKMQTAYAGGGTNIDSVLEGATAGSPVTVGTTLTVKMSTLDSVYGDFKEQYNNGKVEAFWSVDGVRHNAVFTGGKTTYTVKSSDLGKTVSFNTQSVNNEDTNYNNNTAGCLVDENYLIKTNINPATGSFNLTGHSISSEFKHLIVYTGDGKEKDLITSGVNSRKDFSYTFDTSKYDPGYYNMVGVLKNGENIDLSLREVGTGNLYKTYFSSEITLRPTIKKTSDFFSTGYDYVCFSPYFNVPKDSSGKAPFGYIWLQLYDTKKKQWGDSYGPFDSYERLYTEYFTGNKSAGGTKIQANTLYHARVRYGKETFYNGNRLYMWGPWSNTVDIKTGQSSRPAVASIRIKTKKMKKTGLITKAHWDVYGKWHPYSKEYIWTTTYKVTVKLKKKPGAAGLMIGDKKVKGNKTTYTVTFTDSGKLKGKKIKFGICTYNDPQVGGYGKVYKKKVKVE